MTARPPRPRLDARVCAAVLAVTHDAEQMVGEREGHLDTSTRPHDGRVHRGIAWLRQLLQWHDEHGAAAARHERQARRLIADARHEFVCQLGTNTDRDLRENPNLVALRRLVDRLDRWLADDAEAVSVQGSRPSPDP